MKRLSCASTFAGRYVAPLLWIAVFAVLPGWLYLTQQVDSAAWGNGLLLLLWSAGTGSVLWKDMTMKQVWCDAEHLHVSNFIKCISIPLASIASIQQNGWLRTRPVTLSFIHATAFGKRITFIPAREADETSDGPVEHLLLASETAKFFSPCEQQFSYQAGDLLVGRRKNGLFAINKIIGINSFLLKAGESIMVDGRRLAAPRDAHCLLISTSYGVAEFETVAQAHAAAAAGHWSVENSHVAMRPSRAGEGQQLIARAPVTEDELAACRRWKDRFETDRILAG